jgi:hypothetical protein
LRSGLFRFERSAAGGDERRAEDHENEGESGKKVVHGNVAHFQGGLSVRSRLQIQDGAFFGSFPLHGRVVDGANPGRAHAPLGEVPLTRRLQRGEPRRVLRQDVPRLVGQGRGRRGWTVGSLARMVVCGIAWAEWPFLPRVL